MNIADIHTDASIVKRMTSEYKKLLVNEIQDICKQMIQMSHIGNPRIISNGKEYIANLTLILDNYKRAEEIQVSILETLAKQSLREKE